MSGEDLPAWRAERDARDQAVAEAAALAEGFTLEALLRDVEVDLERPQ